MLLVYSVAMQQTYILGSVCPHAKLTTCFCNEKIEAFGGSWSSHGLLGPKSTFQNGSSMLDIHCFLKENSAMTQTLPSPDVLELASSAGAPGSYSPPPSFASLNTPSEPAQQIEVE